MERLPANRLYSKTELRKRGLVLGYRAVEHAMTSASCVDAVEPQDFEVHYRDPYEGNQETEHHDFTYSSEDPNDERWMTPEEIAATKVNHDWPHGNLDDIPF